jgi:peptidoglycan/LPS O-acetylase OafA/YrhL
MSSRPELIAPAVARKRILELDAIRAISCLNLLLFHFTWVYSHKYGFTSPLAYLFPYGKYGVQLFFMLSGFVNVMTLIGKRSTKDFMVARCIRIFPSYWLCILLNVLLFSYLPFFREEVSVGATVANLSTLPRLFGYENMEPVTWTLQVEMLFYTFLILMTAFGGWKNTLRNLMICTVACLAGCAAIHGFKTTWPESGMGGTFRVVEQLFILRNFPLFVMGMLLNEIRNDRGNKIYNVLGILFAAIVFHAVDVRGHNPAATAVLFGLLAFGAWGKIPPLRWKPLVYISSISYPLYLFHNNIGSCCINQLQNFGIEPHVAIVIASGLMIALGAAATMWFEAPITKFLRTKYKAHKAGQGGLPSSVPAKSQAKV